MLWELAHRRRDQEIANHAASFIPIESVLGRGMLSVVPFMLVPAGVAATAFAIAAAVLTHRYRRDRHG